MTLRRVFAATFAAAALLSLTAEAAQARWWGFVTPSRNIACRAYWHGTGFITCTVYSARASFDLEATSAGGRASRVTFKRLFSPHVLAYGCYINFDWWNIRCDSKRAGLMCRNSVGHGFFLSRQSTRVW